MIGDIARWILHTYIHKKRSDANAHEQKKLPMTRNYLWREITSIEVAINYDEKLPLLRRNYLYWGEITSIEVVITSIEVAITSIEEKLPLLRSPPRPDVPMTRNFPSGLMAKQEMDWLKQPSVRSYTNVFCCPIIVTILSYTYTSPTVHLHMQYEKALHGEFCTAKVSAFFPLLCAYKLSLSLFLLDAIFFVFSSPLNSLSVFF